MFLRLLNNDQKKLFLDLALTIAQADEDFSESELNTIKEYCDEMNIKLDKTTPDFPLNQLIDNISNSTNETEKKIIVFETLGLAMVDGIFDEREKKIIEMMSLYFSLDNNFMSQCEEIINEYIKFQNKINSIIFTEGE